MSYQNSPSHSQNIRRSSGVDLNPIIQNAQLNLADPEDYDLDLFSKNQRPFHYLKPNATRNILKSRNLKKSYVDQIDKLQIDQERFYKPRQDELHRFTKYHTKLHQVENQISGVQIPIASKINHNYDEIDRATSRICMTPRLQQSPRNHKSVNPINTGRRHPFPRETTINSEYSINFDMIKKFGGIPLKDINLENSMHKIIGDQFYSNTARNNYDRTAEQTQERRKRKIIKEVRDEEYIQKSLSRASLAESRVFEDDPGIQKVRRSLYRNNTPKPDKKQIKSQNRQYRLTDQEENYNDFGKEEIDYKYHQAPTPETVQHDKYNQQLEKNQNMNLKKSQNFYKNKKEYLSNDKNIDRLQEYNKLLDNASIMINEKFEDPDKKATIDLEIQNYGNNKDNSKNKYDKRRSGSQKLENDPWEQDQQYYKKNSNSLTHQKKFMNTGTNTDTMFQYGSQKSFDKKREKSKGGANSTNQQFYKHEDVDSTQDMNQFEEDGLISDRVEKSIKQISDIKQLPVQQQQQQQQQNYRENNHNHNKNNYMFESSMLDGNNNKVHNRLYNDAFQSPTKKGYSQAYIKEFKHNIREMMKTGERIPLRYLQQWNIKPLPGHGKKSQSPTRELDDTTPNGEKIGDFLKRNCDHDVELRHNKYCNACRDIESAWRGTNKKTGIL